MRRIRLLILILVSAIALAACAPALAPMPVREGDTITVTLAPTQDLYSVTLSVLNVSTTDPRCVVISEIDIGCALGDIAAGEVVTVVGTMATDLPVESAWCSAFAFTEPDLAIGSYRVYPCD